MSELRLVAENNPQSKQPLPLPSANGFTQAEKGDVEALAGLLATAIDTHGYGKYREQLRDGIAREAAEAEQVPVDRLEWRHMAAMQVEQGEKAALSAWEDVKAAAGQELASGHRAASVMEGTQSTPMERARFLAIRAAIIQEWVPRGGIELGLIDTIAQAQSAYLYWLSKLTQRTETEAAEDLRDRQNLDKLMRKSEEERRQEQVYRWGEWIAPRLTTSEAIDQATAAVDRWHRIYIRSLRNLRDLRRYSITINAPGQVNIGEKQVNVSQNLSQNVSRQEGEAMRRPRAKRRRQP